MSEPGGPTLEFAGGAGTVTGSKHLLRFGRRRLLLDCGLFQGLKALRLRNWAEPAFRPTEVDAVLLSHAHIDHCGYLPLLVRLGFAGSVYCTAATADLLGVMLRDSAHLQEEEARTANHRGYSKHHPARPLYTLEDAEAALDRIAVRDFGRSFSPVEGAVCLFRRAGHILGAATVEVALTGPPATRLVFSGDLGRWDRPLLPDPEAIREADVLLVESTYGNRAHPPDADGELARIVRESVSRGGSLIIPAFAVGRSQELVWRLGRLAERNQIPVVPVFLDSPMAIDVTAIYARHAEGASASSAGDGALGPRAQRIRTVAESKSLNDRSGPMIIIAGSGMATGGRVLHHLEARLPDERTTVLLVGFQAAGTRGRSLQEGARSLRMHGREIAVRARVETLDGLSAHADREEILRWLSFFSRPPRHTYVVHGEPPAAASLADAIRGRLGWQVSVAEDGARVSLMA